jgi:arylsulfatase A-like enzyme
VISKSTIADQSTAGPRPDRALAPRRRLGPCDVLALAAWCGLAAGWLEVGTRVLSKSLMASHRFYQMSRHFVWVVPLSNLLLFLVGGLLLAAATKLLPRPGGWLSPRLICAIAALPALLVAGPRIYPWAWFIVASGIAMRLVPLLERAEIGWRRGMLLTFPGLLGAVLVVAGVLFGGDWLKQRREAARPLPPAGAPNVLLIVLDTVRADRMSLYGYQRSTTPALERLAQRGIRFAEARATAPWTLASHASMFSGLLPHELGVKWETPLGTSFPTLAEYLGSQGYATAGFVGNVYYCSYDAGLDRGFTHYEDYPPDLEHLRPLRTALLFESVWKGASRLGTWLSRTQSEPILRWLMARPQKHAAAVNREFVHWLSSRPEPHRPFFAFLNYFDAHAPYYPPEGAEFRFGRKPQNVDDFNVLVTFWTDLDKRALSPRHQELVRDTYDNCLTYLDQQLGVLFDTLKRSGVLDQTVVIVTSDHGEELGEHGLYEHGESLYRPEIRVPLLVSLPARAQSPVVVQETVSLRNLPTTIADLAGLGAAAPFTGPSLVRLWQGASAESVDRVGDGDAAFSELASPSPMNPSHGRSPATRGPLVSLAEGDYVYIRNEGDGREQLFHERDDPDERFNLAKVETMRPRLERLRERLDRIKGKSFRAARTLGSSDTKLNTAVFPSGSNPSPVNNQVWHP